MTSSNGTISASLALCDGNPPVTGGFSSKRLVTESFDDLFDLRLICAGANDQDAGDLKRHSGQYDVTVMWICHPGNAFNQIWDHNTATEHVIESHMYNWGASYLKLI